jgi:hypothetical protein
VHPRSARSSPVDGGILLKSPELKSIDLLPEHRQRACLAVLIAAAVLLAPVVGSPTVRKELTLSFSHQPGPFSELYFMQPGQLAHGGRAGADLVVDFAVANHEGRPASYPYIVTVTTPGKPAVFSYGGLDVRDGAEARQRVAVQVPRSTDDYTVAVSLIGRAENIHSVVGTAPDEATP